VVELTSGGALRAGNMTARDIELVSGAALTAGALTSSDTIGARGIGAVSLGDLSAGLVSPSTASDAEYSVGVASTGGTVTVGTVAAARDIGILAGGGNLTAGTLTAGRDVLLLARDSVATGAITAGATGRITIANASLASLGGALDDFNPEPVFAAPPAPVTGAIAINGAVTGGTLTAAANGNFTPAGALTLGQRLTIARAATATVAAPWTAPMISVASQRLNFAESSTATIGGSATTSLTLRALASGQTAVLGGTSRGEGQGYVLTQGDFARLRSTNLAVQVDAQGGSSSTGARPDLEIRDLTLNGSAASGGLSSLTITTPGWARVVGDLLLAQAGSEDVLTVSGGSRLELVLPDASIAVTGAGGALAGRLQVSSNNLVAATLDLLAQAMADPTAAGLVAALRTPASTTANLDGYLRANAVTLISNANILLQNSGTARDFAGVTVGGGGLIIGRITPATGGGSTGGTGGTSGTGGTTGGTTATSGFSFVGMLMTPSDVLLFDFAVDAASTVTLRTYSYAGGINAAGQVIARGGFDPILSLYNAEGVRIAQNDDGGSNVPADSVSGLRYDTFLTQEVAAGSYKVAVTVFPNFAPNNLSGTYAGATTFADTTGASRTPAFAFDVLGAQTATGPGTQTPSGPGGSSGGLNVVGFGRRVGVGGSQSITGEQFFATIDFGRSGENPVIYSDLSEFNTCLINTGSCGGLVPFEPGPTDPGTSATTTIQALARETLEEEPFEDSAEEDDEAEADAASSPIAPPAPLIDTRPLNPAVDVVEPVSGAGNPALIGSAVNEATAQSGQGDSQ
ncbi:MAG: DVUA0089 family protein, partial [Novosphingobium sp.]